MDVARLHTIFALERSVSTELLERLFSRDDGIDAVPGLMVATDPEQLLARAKSMAGKPALPAAGTVAEVYPFAPFEASGFGRRRVSGAQAGMAALRETIVSPHALLAVHTHSNGYDLMLGDGLALCHVTQDSSGPRAPGCVESRYCHRLRMPLEIASAPGHLIRPHDVQASIFVQLTCHGYLVDGPVHDSYWGYTPKLFDSPTLECVITSWSVLVPSSALFQDLLGLLYQGEPAGRAVAAVNSRHPPGRLAVFGNRDACIIPLDKGEACAFSFGTNLIPQSPGSEALLATVLYQAALTCEGKSSQLAAVASESARFAAHLARLGHSLDDDEPAGRCMRDDAMAFLAENGSLAFELWQPFAVDPPKLRRSDCSSCNSSSDVFAYNLTGGSFPLSRELELCPQCGIRRDTPAGMPLRLVHKDNRLWLEGPRPTRNWRAALHLGCQDRAAGWTVAWPADRDGRPAASIELPDSRPPGPLLLGLIIVQDATFSILNHPLPGNTACE